VKKVFFVPILVFALAGFSDVRAKSQIIMNNMTNQNNFNQQSETNKNSAVNYKYMNKNQGRIDKYLKLTDEQEAESKKLRAESMDKTKSLYIELNTETRKLNQLKLNNGTFAEIDQQKKKVNDLHQQIMKIKDENMVEYNALLTPDQKQKFDEFQQKRMMQMKSKN
jgi:Spy/CpxP family protein refolding chaperone